MKVEALMVRNVRVCRADDPLSVPAGLMWEGDFGWAPVLGRESELIGVITDRDICMGAYLQGGRLDEIPVWKVMSKSVRLCRAQNDIAEAEAVMREHKVRRLPVLDEQERLVGVISLNDIAREASSERLLRETEVTADEVTHTLATVCERALARSREAAAKPSRERLVSA